MAEMNPAPRRLPGRSPSLRTNLQRARATLWLDGSQLLQERVNGYAQEVQRFALADLHAIQVRRTPRGLVYNVILSALLVIPIWEVASSWNESNVPLWDRVFSGVLITLFAGLLLLNTLRGATCRTSVVTALGPQLLPSLSRMGATERALRLIMAEVVAVQGSLRPDEAAQEVDRARAQAQTAPAAPAPPAAVFPGYHY